MQFQKESAEKDDKTYFRNKTLLVQTFSCTYLVTKKSKQIVKKLLGTQILSTTICSTIFDPPCSQKWVLNIVTIMRRNMNLFKRP